MSSRTLKIFLVENHDDTLGYLTGYLRSCGHDVQSARTMERALQVLGSLEIDVLISDIGLPDGDGWELMHQVGEMTRPVPFGIAMSGFNASSDIEKSRSAGYRHHLVKPFLPEELDILLKEAAASVEKTDS